MSDSDIKVLIEGDSWHDLPRLGFKLPGYGGSDYDIARALSDEGFLVRTYARFGHTLERIVNDKDYLHGLEIHEVDAMVICGGGNDLFDGQKLTQILKLYRKDRAPAEYIKAAEFQPLLDRIKDLYRTIFDEVRATPQGADIPIVFHSYDYVIPRRGQPWLHAPMKNRGIFDSSGLPHPGKESLGADILAVMLDRFHRELAVVADEYDENVSLVRLFGSVGDTWHDWHDEIHPRRPGFRRAGALIANRVRLLLAQPDATPIA